MFIQNYVWSIHIFAMHPRLFTVKLGKYLLVVIFNNFKQWFLCLGLMNLALKGCSYLVYDFIEQIYAANFNKTGIYPGIRIIWPCRSGFWQTSVWFEEPCWRGRGKTPRDLYRPKLSEDQPRHRVYLHCVQSCHSDRRICSCYCWWVWSW